ncbi:MAG: hypothetical protein JRI85_16980 [Deltaproteobacteria bacterium]|nr:hypothetical protein [Deltaproteobacteria bacterium]
MKRSRKKKETPEAPYEKNLLDRMSDVYRTLKSVRLFRILGIIAVVLILAAVAICFAEYTAAASL